MNVRSNARRSSTAASPNEAEPDVGQLRSQVAQQSAELSEMRAALAWLAEEVAARDSDVQSMLDAIPGVDDDESAAYRRLKPRLRSFVRDHVPPRTSLAVVSRGDNALLRYPGCNASHLSRDRYGRYVGFHPQSSRAAVAQLEAARWGGTDVLVIPQPEMWWLRHYSQFADHLERRYSLIASDDETGVIWDLRKPSPWREFDDVLRELRFSLGHEPAVLDWQSGGDLAGRFGECNVFGNDSGRAMLPYLDSTVDIVAVPHDDPDRTVEARRVAAAVVVLIDARCSPPKVELVAQRAARASPSTSIVITDLDAAHREEVLHLLLDTLPMGFSGEVVIESSERVLPRLGLDPSLLPNLNVVRARPEDTTSARLRRAAEAASGDVLVFLDGGTGPTPGWLSPLVHLVAGTRDTDVATGMLVEPDGRLASAGGTIDSSGSRHLFGSGDYEIDAVRYGFLRRVAFAPAGLFATRRDLFLQRRRRGSDPVMAFCDEVRANGMAVRYQPESLAISTWISDA